MAQSRPVVAVKEKRKGRSTIIGYKRREQPKITESRKRNVLLYWKEKKKINKRHQKRKKKKRETKHNIKLKPKKTYQQKRRNKQGRASFWNSSFSIFFLPGINSNEQTTPLIKRPRRNSQKIEKIPQYNKKSRNHQFSNKDFIRFLAVGFFAILCVTPSPFPFLVQFGSSNFRGSFCSVAAKQGGAWLILFFFVSPFSLVFFKLPLSFSSSLLPSPPLFLLFISLPPLLSSSLFVVVDPSPPSLFFEEEPPTGKSLHYPFPHEFTPPPPLPYPFFFFLLLLVIHSKK